MTSMASNDKMPSYFKLDKLVTDITDCISTISQEFTCMNIPIDDSGAIFHRFCAKLEQLLTLGLKEKNLFGKKRSYWDYMLRCLATNKGGVHEGLKFVKCNPELKTSVGRGRAFLRFCLVHQCLADALQQCVLSAVEVAKEWYADWAPVRNEAALKLIIASLYDLNQVQFDLSSPSCHDLDLAWPTFNRKELGSPFNWKAISRSTSISSLTSSLSAVDNFNSSCSMGAMGSVQEGSEGNATGSVDGDSGGDRQESVPRGMSGMQGNADRGESEEKEVWWMTEDDGIAGGDFRERMLNAEHNSWAEDERRGGLEEQLRVLKEEMRGREEDWARKEGRWRKMEEEWGRREREWMRVVEEWEVKEREWKEQKKKMEEQHTGGVESFCSTDEERRLEVDMLKARVLELEVVNTMAKWASVGVQATCEDEDGEVCRRLDAEEKLASVCRENEELKRSLVEMKVDCKEESHRCINCNLQSKRKEAQRVGEGKSKSSMKHEDDLRREYESQIRNVRELRGMYEERMRAAEEQSRKLREELQEKTCRLELSRRRCSELRAHSQELETLLGEQEGVARGLQARLSASLEEGRTLAAQLAMVNRLFGRLGDTAELDFERLRLLQNSCEGGTNEDSYDCAGVNDCGNKDDAGCSRSKEEVSDLKEIAVSLPKVWRLLVELLGEEQKEEEKVNEGTTDTEGCFESVPTPYGPRLVISVSRTFIRLKDLILEKKSLQNELGRIRDLNGRLESKLNQQERRLATVKVELKRTWSLVARMRAQHKQLHTSEQVLRYELQQKRKLLGELKQELEYCREKWDLARVKNSQSEKEWQMLRQEFTARRPVEGDPMRESTEVNSPESGFSDGRGEDEEEDVEEVGEDLMATMEYLKCSEEDSSEQESDRCINLQTETSLPFVEENQTLHLQVDILNSESNFELEDSNLCENGTENNASGVAQSENKFLNGESVSTGKAPLCPSGECTQVNIIDFSGMPVPDSTNPQPAGVSTERSIEERLLARAERLRCLEEQCSLLFRKVTHTTTRSAELSSRLEELHEQYGEQQTTRGESRQESSMLADTETGEIPPEMVPPLMLQSQLHAPLEAAAPQPPTPPPLPVSFPPIRLPSLIDCLPCYSSKTDSKLHLTSPVESESYSVELAENSSLPLSSAFDTREIQEVRLHTILSASEENSESANLDASDLLTSPEEGHNVSLHTEESNLPNEELRSASVTGSFLSMVEQPEMDAPLLASQSNSEESLNISEGQEEMLEFEMESVVMSMEGSNVDVETSRDDELGGVIDGVDSDSSVGPSREGSVEEIGLEDREEINEEAYIDGMSSTIYGLHHGPLFDEGNSPSEEECGEDIVEEDDDDEPDEDGINVTSGSIGVASLLLQQLPKRMDILRRERHSLEQRLEEGEAALGRALAGTAAAERRACILEQGLAQAQERLRVLEMEAAVERNERLLEIKSALDVNPANCANVDNCPGNIVQREQSDAGHLQEEIDNLQRATMAQIAGLQAAAVVSKAQTEQLSNLTEEVERQERIVNSLERELASLRHEQAEQAEALNNTHESLKETLQLLAKRQQESDAMELQLHKLRMESEQSNKENIGLFSRLAAAESEVTGLNSEIKQLKDDSDHLREAVIRLTGEKEVLFRANHHLEEMRRLMLEDSRWVADQESEMCTACGVAFSLMVRRHHCRSCGKIFCGACSSHWLALNPNSQGTSLVAGVVDSLMGVTGTGKRSRACADCFAAYSADNREGREAPVASFSQERMVNDQSDSLKMPENGSILPEGMSDNADVVAEGVQGDDDDDDDVEDFSMISEEEVVLSQCTPYVPNPRTLQYWKSCEIQSGVMSTVSDLLAACVPDGGTPGKGQREEVWVRAGAIYSVPLLIQEIHVNILWEFSTNPNSIAFSVLYKSGAEIPMSCALIVVPTTRVNSHLNLAHGRLRPKRAGVYILMFDNSFSRFTGKTISFCLRAEVPSSGRESIASSSRSSVERFPDLPIHQEEVEEGIEGEDANDRIDAVDGTEDGGQ